MTDFAIVDGGAGSIHVRTKMDGDASAISRDEFMSMKWLAKHPDVKNIIGEYAHLQVPQTEASLSQPFTADQLVDMHRNADNAGVSIKLLPEKQAAKARAQYAELADVDGSFSRDSDGSIKKGDSVDTACWFLWVQHNGHDHLQMAFDPRIERGDAPSLVGHTNLFCNAARSFRYDPAWPSNVGKNKVDHVLRFIEGTMGFRASGDNDKESNLRNDRAWCRFLEYAGLSGVIEGLGTGRGKRTVLDRSIKLPRYEDMQMRIGALYSIVASVIHPLSGETVLNSKGRPYSKDYIMRVVVGNTPNHGQMGVARSNIWWHYARHKTAGCFGRGKSDKKRGSPYEAKVGSDDELARKLVHKAVRKLCRKMIGYTVELRSGSVSSGMLGFELEPVTRKAIAAALCEVANVRKPRLEESRIKGQAVVQELF